jgi:hypothetical protein
MAQRFWKVINQSGENRFAFSGITPLDGQQSKFLWRISTRRYTLKHDHLLTLGVHGYIFVPHADGPWGPSGKSVAIRSEGHPFSFEAGESCTATSSRATFL